MQNIPKPRKKASRIKSVLDNLQSIIFKGRISYRLAGLIATAVSIFFIIRLSFYSQGKFMLPVEVGVEDAIKRTEKRELPKKPEVKVASQENFSNEKITQKPGIALSTIKDNELSQKSIIKTEPKQRSKEFDQPGIEFEEVINIAKDDVEMPPGKTIALGKAPTPIAEAAKSKKQKMSDFSIQPAAVSLDKQESNKSRALTEYSRDHAGVRIMQQADSTNAKFIEAFIDARKENKFFEKQKTWENYINTETDLWHIKAAKYQQALLYYNLAKKTNKKEDIQQALNYYFQNGKLLFSGDKPDSVKKQLDELKTLQIILEKNGK